MATIRQIAADLCGGGMQSAGAETEFWERLKTLEIEQVAGIIRQAEPGDRYGIVVAAVKGNRERATALKTHFTAEELADIAARR